MPELGTGLRVYAKYAAVCREINATLSGGTDDKGRGIISFTRRGGRVTPQQIRRFSEARIDGAGTLQVTFINQPRSRAGFNGGFSGRRRSVALRPGDGGGNRRQGNGRNGSR